MIDVEKIKATSSLARSLVEKGFATNIEEACFLIEKQGLVDYEDKLPFTDRQKEALSGSGYEFEEGIEVSPITSATISKAAESVPRVSSNEFMRRLERMEAAVQQMNSFLAKYCKQNDTNIKEIDEGVKKVKLQISGLKSQVSAGSSDTQATLGPQMQSQANTAPRAGERNGALGGVNPKDFAVEKIFSNANGQMMGRIK